MIKDKIITKIFEDIAEEYGLSIAEVEAVYESQWDFIADTIIDLDFNEIDEEEFKDLKTNFNVPALGKLFTTYKKIKDVREKTEKNKREGDLTENGIH